ncbi:hypothetical protein H632_c1178p0, partial [Helicosporidium sp. ATCC 50920]
RVGRYFKVQERGSTFTQEVVGGLVAFVTVAYILSVNASILSETGGMCPTNGACPRGPASANEPACIACVTRTRHDLITATAVSAIVGNALMGVIGNVPFILSPGMGLNAYFAYTVVGYYGTGFVSYPSALALVFIEGWIFIALSLLGVRSWVTSTIPTALWHAAGAGIGLFLAFVGLQQSQGVGVVTYSGATGLTLGGCPPDARSHQYSFYDSQLSQACTLTPEGQPALNATLEAWTPSNNYACGTWGIMRSGTTWLGIGGGLLMAVLMARKVRGSLLLGILFVTFVSWIPTASNYAAYLGDGAGVGGAARLEYFKKVVSLPSLGMVGGKLSFAGLGTGQAWLALITFLYVDFLDATSTFFAVATYLNLSHPGFIDPRTRRFERQMGAFCVDGLSISLGALVGTSPVTVYGESAAGVREGARTGVAALTVALCFCGSLFFTPLIASIPPYATGPALIMVGAMMVVNVLHVHWDDVAVGVPAFLTVVVMPLTASIAYGLVAGIFSYLIIHVALLLWCFVELKTRGRPPHVPRDASLRATLLCMLRDLKPKRGDDPDADAPPLHPIAEEGPYGDRAHEMPPEGLLVADKDVDGEAEVARKVFGRLSATIGMPARLGSHEKKSAPSPLAPRRSGLREEGLQVRTSSVMLPTLSSTLTGSPMRRRVELPPNFPVGDEMMGPVVPPPSHAVLPGAAPPADKAFSRLSTETPGAGPQV